MYSVIANGERITPGINFYLTDTLEELQGLKKVQPASKGYVLADQKTYILNHKGEWVEYYPALKKYVDEQLAAVDPALVEELKELLAQIESGDIDGKISAEVTKQLEEKDYITENDLISKNYVTNEELAASRFVSEDSLAEKDFLTSAALEEKGYLTNDDLAAKNYVSNDDLDAKNYVSNNDLVAKNYITNDELESKGYLTSSALGDYATKEELPKNLSELTDDVGYLTQIPEEYITETELNNKGYITEHQSLAGYATEAFVDNSVSSAASLLQLEINELEVPFKNNETVGSAIGGFKAGDSLHGMSVKAILAKILNVGGEPIDPPTPPEEEKTIVEIIIDEQIAAYDGLGDDAAEGEFLLLNGTTAKFDDVGFYTIYSGETLVEAGYQVATAAGDDGYSPYVLIPEIAEVENIWQFDDGITQQFNIVSILPDDTYFYEDGTQTINGKVYKVYRWNEDAQGGSMYVPAYWRFEMKI